MKWLDILTGEVHARRDHHNHAQQQRQDMDEAVNRQHAMAAMKFVVRPALAGQAAALKRRKFSVEVSGDDDAQTFSARAARGTQAFTLEFRPEADTGNIRVTWKHGGKNTGGAQVIAAGHLSTATVREMVERLLAGD